MTCKQCARAATGMWHGIGPDRGDCGMSLSVIRNLMIGIDPGVHTGVAVWDMERRELIAVCSTGMFGATGIVQRHHNEGHMHSVVFEDARLRKWFGSKGREALQGAGSIKRECQLWAEWLAAVGCSYRAVSPHSKGPKLDAAQFARLTGWPGRTNEHGRDAAMLVFGRIA